MKTEADILQALSQNNHKVYELLYREYFAMCQYFITKNSGSKAEAQDVFQDAIIVLYEKTKQPTFKLSCTLKTYIYSIVRNLWLKALAKKKKTVSLTDFEKYYAIEATEDVTEKDTKIDLVLDSLKLLGEKCQKILVSFYFEKKKMSLIAEELGYTNAENAKNQKYKCMQQLKKFVK